MSEVFLKIVNMSISASWIVLAVLLLRILLKRTPRWIAVLLWGIVGIRLIFPFSIESVMSLIPSAETISPKIMTESNPSINTGIPIINNSLNPIISNSFTPAPEASANPLQIWIPVFSIIWVMGIVILLAYTGISYWRICRKVCTAVLLRNNVYQSEAIVSPFVLGVIKPKIYLPFHMSRQDEELVISHEEAHIKRKDHLWKPLGFLILTFHWFNPLMWLGYVLLCRDIEIACDEKVVKELTNEQRADYSQALLTCSVNRRMIAACPLAFGEVGIKERVKSVLNYKKPAFWMIVVSVIAIFITSICLLTNPKTYEISDLDDQLCLLIDTSIKKHHESAHTDDNFIAIDYEILGVHSSLSETKVYMWVLYMEYSCEGGVLKNEAGAHTPTVITAKKNISASKNGLITYELKEYWDPGDGSHYVKDIKDKFPRKLWSKALDSQLYIDQQNTKCENAAKEYFNISNSTVGGVSAPNTIFLPDTTYEFKSGKDIAQLTLSTTNNEGSFRYSLLSSYMAYGTYENDGNYIILKTSDGKFKYTFKKGNGTMKFIASKSSTLPSYAYSSGAKAEVCVPDGAIFEKINPVFANTIDNIAFDIDKDGKIESCVLGYGPTSGLFTFTLTVTESGKTEYFNIFYSPIFYHLSFDVQGGELRLKGMEQEENHETKYFDFSAVGSNILIKNDNKTMEYWGEQGLESPFAPDSIIK